MIDDVEALGPPPDANLLGDPGDWRLFWPRLLVALALVALVALVAICLAIVCLTLALNSPVWRHDRVTSYAWGRTIRAA